MKRFMVQINSEKIDQVAVRIKNLVHLFSESFSLVVRDEFSKNAESDELLGRLLPSLLKSERTASWPGTTLLGGMATVHHYLVDKNSLAILWERRSLLSFHEPNSPEDICFYRRDGSPWLVTISHDEDMYFLIDEDEFSELAKHFPGCLQVSH